MAVALATLATGTAAPDDGEEANVAEDRFDSIVRIEVAAANPDYETPWNPPRPSAGSGTGFLIGPNQILTNAHVVSNASRVIVKKVGDPRPYPASVKHIAHDADLAMLELDDPSAFGSVPYLEIGEIPQLDTEVTAVGYPIGGERISVTRGIVSRIDFLPYSHSGVDHHLAIQVDAAINPGNSGGPVLQDGAVVGVAFQGYSGAVAQNVGYMIPTPVVERFLKDIEDGSYDRYVDLNVADFAIVNPAQRAALRLPDELSGQGVMVGVVEPEGSAGGVLKVGDVLLSIDGNPIASNGFIQLNGERVNMNEIVERKFAGDTITLEFWRDGQRFESEVTLKPFEPYLITANQYGERPEYIVYAGLVFQPLDRNLMAAHEIQDETVRYWFDRFVGDQLYKERPQPVVFTSALPDEVNTHIAGYAHAIVDEVDGKKITTMKDMLEAIRAARENTEGEFITIRLLGEGRPLILEKSAVEEANDRILATYDIADPYYVK
jgi:S1-C subfamily serine protease